MEQQNNNSNGKCEEFIKYSLVIPVYKNEASIPDLFMELENSLISISTSLEIIFVIDGSPDSSEEIVKLLSKSTPLNVNIVVHSRNFGAFAAIRTGLKVASGDLVGVMSADLQEHPTLVLDLFNKLKIEKADIAFGIRVIRNDPLVSRIMSTMYWALYRKLINRDVPKGGVDLFACRKEVITRINSMPEVNTSLIGLLFWVGYRRVFVEYERNLRKFGKSSWTFKSKFKYMADSIFSFSDLPIRIVRGIGFSGFVFSIVFGTFLVIASIAGRIEVPGYAPIMLAITLGNSSILIALSILGSYLWRIFANTQGRPFSIITENREIEEK